MMLRHLSFLVKDLGFAFLMRIFVASCYLAWARANFSSRMTAG